MSENAANKQTNKQTDFHIYNNFRDIIKIAVYIKNLQQMTEFYSLTWLKNKLIKTGISKYCKQLFLGACENLLVDYLNV